MAPSLTTVDIPAEDIGRHAASRLLDRIADRTGQPERRDLPITLVTRHSTAAP
ncbi:MAG: substrate-binding domain-containing protein [Roseinatronobacter sp.]